MDHFQMTQAPELKDTVLIAAFTGWNDASEVATSVARFLVREWEAVKFASIEPDEFYVFTESRPRVSIGSNDGRRIEWASNEFWYRPPAPQQRDVVLLVGVEPQLRWRSFVSSILDVARRVNVSTIVTLGGLLADVPHTRPTRVTGSSNVDQLTERLGQFGVFGSRYEGPTGIVGVLNTTAGQENLTTVSMWGNVPHYVSATMNPNVTRTLLEKVDALLGFDLDLSEWEAMGRRFDVEVADAISRNPQIAAYVRDLEARHPLEESEVEPRSSPSELPDSETIVRELEEFLKRSQDDDDDDE